MKLPIYSIKDTILKAISENPIITIVGETGSGKTTQLPQWMLEKYDKVAITQPRRVAAVTVADRVAEELKDNGVEGNVCGYKIRFVDKTNRHTRLVFMTDGVLLRMLHNDPVLKDFNVVILDEAHERSLETDILFGILKVIHSKRPDLRIIVMSATLDSDKFTKYFNYCPVIEIPGRHFDVDIHHMRSGNVTISNFVKKSIETALFIHRNQPTGDILVFLTGQGEIEYACRTLKDLNDELVEEDIADPVVEGLIALPLYASLEPREQKKVFETADKGIRKIIFATNIAATSVTIPDIKYVVDCGFVKQKEYDEKLDMDALLVTRISKAAADQRAGRAGRTAHGICWRLYSVDEYEKFLPSTTPEIQRTSLTSTVLTLKSLGIRNILDFPFMDPPNKSFILSAGKQLYFLSALSETGEITKIGRLLSIFPMSAALARALIASSQEPYRCSKQVATICACLSVEDIFITPRHEREQEEAKKIHCQWFHRSGDHLTYLNIIVAFKYAQNIGNDEEKRFCKRNYLKTKIIFKVLDIERQLLELMEKNNIPVFNILANRSKRAHSKSFDDFERELKHDFLKDLEYPRVLKSFLIAFYPNLARKHPSMPTFYHFASTVDCNQDSNTSSKYLALTIQPGSALDSSRKDSLEWVFFNDISFTTRAMMQIVSKGYKDWVPSQLLDRLQCKIDLECLVGDVDKREEIVRIKQEQIAGKAVATHAVTDKRTTEEDVLDAKARYLERKKQKN